jgi:hypothetical protein
MRPFLIYGTQSPAVMCVMILESVGWQSRRDLVRGVMYGTSGSALS